MSESFDPLDEVKVVKFLQQTLESVFLPPITIRKPPKRITAATSAWVWFIELEGENLPIEMQGPTVLRISEPKEKAILARQVSLSESLIAQGFPVPQSYWHGEIEGFPAELQQRLFGRQAIDLLGTRKARKTLQALATLQAELHALSTKDFKVPHLNAISFLTEDLDLRRARVKSQDDSGTWEWLHQNASNILMGSDEASVLCHGDFHPLNALVTMDGKFGIVDWTDASLSDRHHDVGRTIATYWFGALVAETKIQRVALRFLRPWMRKTHRRAYEKSASIRLNKDRLKWWQVAHLYRFWLLLAELADGKVAARESSTLTGLPDDLMDQIIRRCVKLQSI